MVKFEKKRSAFGHPILVEMQVGDEVVIGEGTLMRKHDGIFINKNAYVYPTSYWAPGMVRCKKVAAGFGAESFSLDVKHAKIASFAYNYLRRPDWYLRMMHGYAGPMTAPFEFITESNWWQSMRVEELITTLCGVCHKRTLPEWYDTVIAYVVHRINVDKVLKFQDLPPLVHQVSGIISLEPINQALRIALRDDITRYKEIFSDDTVDKHLTDLLEIPEERSFIRELQTEAGTKRTAIGFATNGNGNGHSKN